MILPKAERRSVSERGKKRRIWVYGAPFSGKTTLADKFPMPLMLNTDGNADEFSSQSIAIKDIVEVDGRITKTTLAWEVFKDTLEKLEAGSDFKTIVVDLVEDMYESCRLYMYREMGITHESDDSFRAWDKVRTEFLSTMRKLMNLDYDNIILISHEDTSKDITKRTGDKISSVRPNIQEKVANKLAGMVDVVIRCVVIDGKHLLSFKTDEVVFGGGRIKLTVDEIPNDYNALMEAIHGGEVPKARSEEEENVSTVAVEGEPIDLEKPKKRERKARTAEEQAKANEETVAELTGLEETVDCFNDTPPEEEPTPAPRRRRRRSAE